MFSRLARLSLLAVVAFGLMGGTAHAVDGDFYASPIVIPAEGGTSTTPVTGAYIEPGESRASISGTPVEWTVWYAWGLPAASLTDVAVQADLCGTDLATEPDFITNLSYRFAASGIGGSSLASTETGCPPKGGFYTVARVNFTATPGTDYRFVAGSGPTAIGDLTFTLATAPYATAAPSITGTARIGQTLTAASATWTLAGGIVDPPAWQRCNAEGGSCVDIAGANTSTYLIAEGDLGSTIRVRSTGHNELGSTTVSSPVTAVIEKEKDKAVAPVKPIAGLDTDGDGVVDTLDTDDDNDGLLDEVERAYGYDPLKKDTNGDGRLDGEDACKRFGLCSKVELGAGGTKVIVVADESPKPGTTTQSITGTSGNDSIYNTIGTADPSILTALLNSLKCSGAAGNDLCFGGRATDICTAGKGNDTCIGNAGADSCTSTSGIDTCRGGTGADVCTAKLNINAKLVEAGFPARPVVGCDGGAGDDTCTATISPPSFATLSSTTELMAYMTKLGTTRAACTGGAGNDMCKVASRSWDPFTGVSGDLKELLAGRVLKAAPTLSTTCSGGAGTDTCVAKNAMSWAIGSLGAVGSTTICNGGAGNDLLLTANGKAGDTIIGGAGADVCWADAGDKVSGCSTTYKIGGLTQIANQRTSSWQSTAGILAGVGGIISGGLQYHIDSDAGARAEAEAYAKELVVTKDGVQTEEEFMLNMVALIHDIQQKLQAIQQSSTDTMRIIGRI